MIKSKITSKKVKISLMTVMALFIMSSSAYSQGYYHGLGVQYNIGSFKQEASFGSNSETLGLPGVFYKATLAFSENFAISAYPFLGFSGTASSRGDSDLSIGIQLPIVAELYFGDIDEANFFIGGGFSYATLGSTDIETAKSFGPQISAGAQFEIAGQLVGIRAAFVYGLNKSETLNGTIEYTKDTHNVLSLGAYYTLGGN